MKIAFTVSDYAAAAYVGAEVDRTTWVMELPEDNIPADLYECLRRMDEAGEKEASSYATVSLSIVKS